MRNIKTHFKRVVTHAIVEDRPVSPGDVAGEFAENRIKHLRDVLHLEARFVARDCDQDSPRWISRSANGMTGQRLARSQSRHLDSRSVPQGMPDDSRLGEAGAKVVKVDSDELAIQNLDQPTDAGNERVN